MLINSRFTKQKYICLDLQKRGYRNLSYTLWRSLVAEQLFFRSYFLFI